MSPRAIWKASLEFGAIRVPVKLYAAVEDRDVHFRLLHAKDGVPVRQRLVDPRTEREIPFEEAKRGIAIEPGLFVVLRAEELDRETPKPSRSIEITRFVPAAAIDAAWYARPYFLGPDAAAASYGALHHALRDAELRGIARWTMRGKRYFGALEARESHLALIALRAADEVVAARDLDVSPSKTVSAAERALADQLVAALDGPFDPATLEDDYRERVMKLVAAKAKGRRTRIESDEKMPTAVPDLARALKRSLQDAKGKLRAA